MLVGDEDDSSSLLLHHHAIQSHSENTFSNIKQTPASPGLKDLTECHLQTGVKTDRKSPLLTESKSAPVIKLNKVKHSTPASPGKLRFKDASHKVNPYLNGKAPVHNFDGDVDGHVLHPDKCYDWLLPTQSADVGISNLTSSPSGSNSHISVPLPPPPDGGWGWLVVLGAFLISVFCDGLSYCLGIIYSEILVQFGENRSKTSLFPALFYGIAMMLGPFASALTSRFGCRKMTIFGGLLSSLGLFLSYFATSIEMLCITFSVIVGIGFSFCFITSVVIVAFYFDKKRALATGLAVCGTGVGTFTFAPLLKYLIKEYGWRGQFLILSGLSLNLVVCGMLFRPLQFTETQRCRMLLDVFNKIPPSREELETGGGGYVYSSTSESSSETDSTSYSDKIGCWTLAKKRNGSSSSKDDDGSDNVLEGDVDGKPVKSLSALSLPTFVHTMTSGTVASSPVLLEAIRGSKNPHLTVHRFMKNAYLQIEQSRQLQVSPKRMRHMSERAPVSSPVDPSMYSVSAAYSLQQKYNNTYTDLHDKHNVCGIAVVHKQKHTDDKGSKEFYVMDHSCQKALYISDSTLVNNLDCSSVASKNTDGICALQSPCTRKPNNCKHVSKHSKKESNMNRDNAPNKIDQSISGLIHVHRPSANSKRHSNFFIGRHNALSIHLPLYRNDIFYRRSVIDSFKYQPGCILGTSCPEFIDMPSLQETNQPRNKILRFIVNFFKDAADVFKSMVEFRLFLNPFFLLFVASNFVYYFWSDVPYLYVTDDAKARGVDESQALFLVSIIGIFNTVGQVIFGYIGDMQVNLLNIYAAVSAVSGLFVALVPFVSSYLNLSIMYACFGFCASVTFPLTTILLVNYLGVERLTNAYGLLMMVQGIANVFGPPTAGWVSDQRGSYDLAFVLSGLFYGISGVILFFAYLPACRRYEDKLSEKRTLSRSIGEISTEQRVPEDGSPV